MTNHAPMHFPTWNVDFFTALILLLVSREKSFITFLKMAIISLLR